MENISRENWFSFKCRMPAEAFYRLEDELDRIKTLAEIDGGLPEVVQDGLALELIVANSANTPDESVV